MEKNSWHIGCNLLQLPYAYYRNRKWGMTLSNRKQRLSIYHNPSPPPSNHCGGSGKASDNTTWTTLRRRTEDEVYFSPKWDKVCQPFSRIVASSILSMCKTYSNTTFLQNTCRFVLPDKNCIQWKTKQNKTKQNKTKQNKTQKTKTKKNIFFLLPETMILLSSP